MVTLDSLWNALTRNTGPELREVLGISPVPVDGAIFGPITRADQGLCGGMVYTVMDYFHAAQTPPLPARQDAAGRHLPPDQPDDPLFLHIRERLLDSFDILGRGHRWLSYTSPIYPDDDEGVAQSLQLMKGKSWVTYREEWPRIRELLDQQRLVPIGLVQADNFDIGKNHQVLAYAYEQSGQNVKLWIYDPNVPAQDGKPLEQGEPADEIPVTDDLFLEFDTTDTSRAVSVTRHHYAKSDVKTIHAILWLDNYAPKHPPVPGLPLPPAVNERHVNVIAALPKVTVRAEEVRRTDPGRCGNVLRFGVWTTDTSQRFVAVPGGFISPKVKWTVGGVVLEEGWKRFKVHHGGQEFGVNLDITLGGTCLSLTSDVGDRYLLSVVATVSDVLGPPVVSTQEVLFEVAGGYEGMHPDDLRTEARCIAESVPVPHDLLKFTVPKPEGPQPDWDQWKAERLQALETDPRLTPAARGAIEDYVRLQASGPEFRQAARQLAQRVKFGPK